MKQLFLGGMVAIAVIAGFGYLLWATAKQLFDDWKLNREVKEIKQEMAEIKRRKAAETDAIVDSPEVEQPLIDQGIADAGRSDAPS